MDIKNESNAKERILRPGESIHVRETSAQVELPETNSRESFTIVPSFHAESPKAKIPRSHTGSSGIYAVTFVLAIPGKEIYRSDLDMERIMNSGDSLLLVRKGICLEITISDPMQRHAEFRVWPNDDGSLAKAQIRLNANNISDAETRAYDLIMAFLSYLSYHHDVALDITAYEILEERTDVRKYSVGVQGKRKAFDSNTLNALQVVKPEYVTAFAAYREALNSTSPFYQLLCFYKVIEGVKKIRDKRREEVLKRGKEYRDPSERIPSKLTDIPVSDAAGRNLFRPYLGKKFTRVIDTELRPLFRHAIAHLDPRGHSLVIDRFHHITECEAAMPVIKFIARQMLRNEIKADPDMIQVSALL